MRSSWVLSHCVIILGCIFFFKAEYWISLCCLTLSYCPFLYSKFLFNIRFILLEVQECTNDIGHKSMGKIFHYSLHIAHFHPFSGFYSQNL